MLEKDEARTAPQNPSQAALQEKRVQQGKASQLSPALSFAESLVPFLLATTSFAAIYYRFRQQAVQGPGWDPFAFLANGLEFAGKGIGYSELHRPPLISFLTSLLFRTGWVSESALFAVDAALVFLGIIGFYKLLNLRFSAWLSFLGALFFFSFPPIIGLATTGYTDVPSVALSVWTIYFFVLALEKDSRYHWVTWPLFTLTVLMRFTGLLLIVPLLPLLLGRATVLRNLKDIAIGIFLSFLIALPAFFLYYLKFGDPIFPFTHAFFAVSEPAPTENFTLSGNVAWFLVNMKSFVLNQRLSALFPLLLAMIALGLVLRLVKLVKRTGRDLYYYLFLAAVLAFYLLVFFKAGFVIRQISLVVLGTLLYHYFQKADQKYITLNIIFLLWFLTYFDFHSHDPIKIERYFAVMAPGVAFFTLEGLEAIGKALGNRVLTAAWNGLVAVMIAMAILASLVATFASRVERDYLVNDTVRTSSWLKKNDSRISQAKIYSDLWPVFSWYLRENVEPMPFFKDERAFDHALVKQDVDYYLAIRERKLPSYQVAAQIGSVTVFKRNPALAQAQTRILYLGMNWEHYLEDVLDFKHSVVYEPGKYYLGKSLYLDGYTLKELKEYPLVIMYNFRWHNRKKAESLLRDYVSSGGSIIVDASGNRQSIPYNLEGDSFLDVSILRKSLPEKPDIRISPDLPVAKVEFSPFVSDGEAWYGMTYENLDEKIPFKVLATANGETLIAEQRLGKGKIIWMGFNLVWHSFYKENRAEQKLIQGLVTYALQKDS